MREELSQKTAELDQSREDIRIMMNALASHADALGFQGATVDICISGSSDGDQGMELYDIAKSREVNLNFAKEVAIKTEILKAAEKKLEISKNAISELNSLRNLNRDATERMERKVRILRFEINHLFIN